MSNIAFLFLPLAFSSLPAVLPFVSPSSQVPWRAPPCVGRGRRIHFWSESLLLLLLLGWTLIAQRIYIYTQ